MGIDLVKLLARGITVFQAPVAIISKLYKFVKRPMTTAAAEDSSGEERKLGVEESRMLLSAFCATKVTLIDVMPEIVDTKPKHKKIKGKY